MKVYDAASLRNVAAGRPLRLRQDAARLRPPLRCRRRQPPRQSRRGTTVTDYDEEEIARKHTLSASLAYAEWNKTKINFIDTPGLGELPERRARARCASPTPPWSSSTSLPASRSRPRRCGRRRTSWRCRGSIVAEPARSRARQPRAVARVAARRVRPHRHPDPAADRRGEGLRRRGRPGGDEGVHVRRTTAAASSIDGADPRRHDRDGQRGARGADRDGRRGRRRADGEVLRRRHAEPGRSRRRAQARRRRGADLPGPPDLGHRQHRHAAAARRARRLRAVAGRAAAHARANADGDEVEIATKDGGPASAFVWKTVADPFAGRITLFRVRLGHAQGGLDDDTTRAATRPSGSAT